MANPLSGLTLAEVQADLVKVEAVVAVVEKYAALLPLSATVETGITDLDNALKFAETVLADL